VILCSFCNHDTLYASEWSVLFKFNFLTTSINTKFYKLPSSITKLQHLPHILYFFLNIVFLCYGSLSTSFSSYKNIFLIIKFSPWSDPHQSLHVFLLLVLIKKYESFSFVFFLPLTTMGIQTSHGPTFHICRKFLQTNFSSSTSHWLCSFVIFHSSSNKPVHGVGACFTFFLFSSMTLSPKFLTSLQFLLLLFTFSLQFSRLLDTLLQIKEN
jgi:hypothetical protein